MEPVTVTITDEATYMDYLESLATGQLLELAVICQSLADHPIQHHKIGAATFEDVQQFAARVEAVYGQLVPDDVAGGCTEDSADEWVSRYYTAIEPPRTSSLISGAVDQ